MGGDKFRPGESEVKKLAVLLDLIFIMVKRIEKENKPSYSVIEG
jgi:hypothetical protein